MTVYTWYDCVSLAPAPARTRHYNPSQIPVFQTRGQGGGGAVRQAGGQPQDAPGAGPLLRLLLGALRSPRGLVRPTHFVL